MLICATERLLLSGQLQVCSLGGTSISSQMFSAPLAVRPLCGVGTSSTVTGRPLVALPGVNVFCLVLRAFLEVGGGSVVLGPCWHPGFLSSGSCWQRREEED